LRVLGIVANYKRGKYDRLTAGHTATVC
jgi:hypothetical protein